MTAEKILETINALVEEHTINAVAAAHLAGVRMGLARATEEEVEKCYDVVIAANKGHEGRNAGRALVHGWEAIVRPG